MSHIVYDGFKSENIAQVSPELKDRTFIINGVSKVYSMTGWRIGYGVGSPELIKAISKVQSQSTSNPCSISQAAAVEALNGTQDFIEENNNVFKKRRDKALDLLNAIDGIECKTPNGAFYVFANCRGLIGKNTPSGKILESDQDFAAYLLDEALVAVVQGSAFGMEGFFRISYALADDMLIEACNRIASACGKLA